MVCTIPSEHPVTLISFGYLHTHGAAPTDAHVIDVRDSLRDPAAARAILDLDGRDWRVQRVVLNTPGAIELLTDVVDLAERMPADQPRRIAIGCAGGRHRSAALVELAAALLRDIGVPVVVEHQHIHLPRVLRDATDNGGAA